LATGSWVTASVRTQPATPRATLLPRTRPRTA
jgi:hypothetical protein